MDRLGEKVGGESPVKSRNKYKIKINLHLMKRRMEISQHCWKFTYKHSDISIFAVCNRFYFLWFFLPAQEWEIFFFTKKPAVVAFTVILMAAWEGLTFPDNSLTLKKIKFPWYVWTLNMWLHHSFQLCHPHPHPPSLSLQPALMEQCSVKHSSSWSCFNQ